MTTHTKPTSRRHFLCWCCATATTPLTAASAQTTPYSRTILSKQDYPGTDHITLQVQIDPAPGYYITPHTHPGVETSTLVTS